MKRKLVGIGAVLTAGLIIAWLGHSLLSSSFRRALPRNASDIHSFPQSYALSQGHYYYLRARLPEGDFLPYVRRLGLPHYSADRKLKSSSGDIDWGSAPRSLEWWTPSPSRSNTYGREDTELVLAKWEDGYVYVKYYCD